MLTVVLIFMVVFAIATLQSKSLRHSVIYLSVFSLLCSFAYTLYHAPDVAIAEAVIGCSLSTVLYLVAIKKYRIFRIYYSTQITPSHRTLLEDSLITSIEKYMHSIELELDWIFTTDTFEHLHGFPDYDVIIEHTDTGFHIYGSESNYHYEGLAHHLMLHTSLPIHYNHSNTNHKEVNE